jgi:hypothetical protein
VETSPCSHKAGRILLHLIFLNNLDVDDAVGGGMRQAARRATVHSMKRKMISFVDDPNYLMELAIG